jgi:hypothetical protein
VAGGRGPAAPEIPQAARVVLTALCLLWAAVYWRGYGPANFLWFCDLANFLIVAALWARSPLLLSAQAVSVVAAQIAWSLDLAIRLLTGSHWIGATEHLFDPALARSLRLAALFHVAVPGIVLWALWRMGYDRRGWRLQTAIAWVVLPASWLVGPDSNLNFSWGPGESPQTLVHPLVYLLGLMLGYPLVLYLPAHLVFRCWSPGDAQSGQGAIAERRARAGARGVRTGRAP